MVTSREMWRDVQGYKGLYLISNLGRIKSLRKDKVMHPAKTPAGYYYVTLSDGHTKKKQYIHRLVAEAFLPKPDDCNIVNHLNGITTDNRVHNLEWCDQKRNIQHAVYELGRMGRLFYPMREVMCVETGEKFESISAAARSKNLNVQNLFSACKGRYHTCGGLHWEYVNGN